MRPISALLGVIIAISAIYVLSFHRLPATTTSNAGSASNANTISEPPPPLIDKLDRLDEKLDQIAFRLEDVSKSRFSEYESTVKSIGKAMNQQISQLEILNNRLREQHDASWKADPASSWNSSVAGTTQANARPTQPYGHLVFGSGYWWLKGADGTAYYQTDQDSLVKFVRHVNYHVTGQPVENDAFAAACASGQCGVVVTPVSYTGAANYSSGSNVSVSSYGGSDVSVKVAGGYGAGKVGKSGGGGILDIFGKAASGLGRVAVGSRRGKQSASIVAVESQPLQFAYIQPQFSSQVFASPQSQQFASPQSPPVPLKSQPPLPSKSPGVSPGTPGVQPGSFIQPQFQQRPTVRNFAFQQPLGRR